MEERLRVRKLDPENADSLEEVFQECLIQRGLGSHTPRYQPLEAIIQLVKRLGARAAVVQSNVQDPDFMAEHAAYYSRWTSDVPRYCERIHFFSEAPVSNDVLEVIDQMAGSVDVYLGFVTLRPISMSPVAATILKPSMEAVPSYLLSNDEFTINLAGRRFTVNGTPFMQQDNAVGACAQASIWMALRTLRKKAGQAAFDPAQITDAATRYSVVGRTLPNRGGLTLQQVTEAIRATGYAPHVIPLRRKGEAVSEQALGKMKAELYPYVESGIPVLLLLFPDQSEGHAIVVIGHGWNAEPPFFVEYNIISPSGRSAPMRVVDAASWVEPYVIHNDNSGPYLMLPDRAGSGYALSQARVAIPLLQTDVFIDGAEARQSCMKLLSDSVARWEILGGEKPAFPDLVARVYLQSRAEFRQNVLNSDEPKEVKRYYRMKWLPKRIWITEFNLLEGYGKAPENQGKCLGRVLLDPAAEAEEGAFLAIHLSKELLPPNQESIEGVIIDRDVFNGEIEAFPVSDFDYAPLARDAVV